MADFRLIIGEPPFGPLSKEALGMSPEFVVFIVDDPDAAFQGKMAVTEGTA